MSGFFVYVLLLCMLCACAGGFRAATHNLASPRAPTTPSKTPGRPNTLFGLVFLPVSSFFSFICIPEADLGIINYLLFVDRTCIKAGTLTSSFIIIILLYIWYRMSPAYVKLKLILFFQGRNLKKRGAQMKSIDSYFKVPRRPTDVCVCVYQEPSTSKSVSNVFGENISSLSYSVDLQNPNSSSTKSVVSDICLKTSHQSSQSNTNLIHENDIGHFINSKVDDMTKYNLLQNPWKPTNDYKFPHSVHNVNGKEIKRYLGVQHFKNHKWLVLSHFKQGVFCKYCALFSGEKVGYNKNATAQKFVTKPVTTFSKLFGKDGFLTSHENTQYHKECVQAGQDFIRTFNYPGEEVINKVNKQRLEQVEENRSRLRPTVETAISLGR